jgi:hypothetical protein
MLFLCISHPTSTMNMTALQPVNNITLCRTLMWLILSCFIMCTVLSKYICTVFCYQINYLSLSPCLDSMTLCFPSPPTQSRCTEEWKLLWNIWYFGWVWYFEGWAVTIFAFALLSNACCLLWLFPKLTVLRCWSVYSLWQTNYSL